MLTWRSTVRCKPLLSVGAGQGLVILVAALLCMHCNARGTAQPKSQSQPAASPAKPIPTAAPKPVAAATLLKRSRPLMGTLFEITVFGVENAETLAAIDQAFSEMSRLESLLSEWQPDSEISAINRNAGKGAVHVSEDTWKVIQTGIEVSRSSHGAFDMTWAGMRDLYLFQKGQEVVPTAAQITARLPLVRWQDTQLNPQQRTIGLARKGMALGTGGIGKGYALDRASVVLKKAGIANFMIFGGGQVQVSGKKGDRAWRVGIQHPRQPSYFAYIEAEAGSISTSGDYEHAFVAKDGTRWHHIIDPKTGYPARGVLSVTVLADTGLIADAVTKPIFILGHEKGFALLNTFAGAPQAVVVTEKLEVFVTDGFKNQLVFTQPLKNNRL